MSEKNKTQSQSQNDLNDLRRQLLIEQLEAARLQNRRGWLWHMGPTLAAIAASIAASVIVIIFGSQAVKGVVSYYESGVNTARQQLNEIEVEIDSLRIKRDSALREFVSAEKKKAALLLNLSALQDYESVDELNNEIGVSIKIRDDKISYSLLVDSFPEGAKILAFCECDENFAFPKQNPNISTCRLFFGIESSDGQHQKGGYTPVYGKTPCIIGPIGKMGNMDNTVWVMAEIGDRRTYRYVHLTGF